MSTYVFVKERLHPGHLDILRRGGAQTVEIFAARGHFDYTNRTHVREVASWFQGNGIEMNSLHSPMYSDYDWGKDGSPAINLAEPDRRRRVDSMDEIKRAIETAEVLPFRFLVQHIGTSNEEFDERKFEAALSSIEHLQAFARPLGVTLLVENIPNELSTPEKLLDLLKAGHFDDMGVCFDIGHAHIAGGAVPAFESLRDRIRSTHIHDNKQDRDAHLWPGEGTIDWNDGMALLHSAPQVPALVMEINGDEKPDVAAGMAKTFRMLETAGQKTV